MTLVELLIGGVLMGMILYSVWSIVQAGSRYLLVSNETLEVQTNCLLSVTRLGQELGESDPNTLYCDATGLEFASPRDLSGALCYDSYGRMQWTKWISYYQDSSGPVPRLLRKEKLMSPPLVYPPEAPTANDVAVDGTLYPRVMARGVTVFQITNGNPVQLAITVAMADIGKSFSLQMNTMIYLRN